MEPRYLVVRLVVEELGLRWKYHEMCEVFHSLEVENIFGGYEPWRQDTRGRWYSDYFDDTYGAIWDARDSGDNSHEGYELIAPLKERLQDWKEERGRTTDDGDRNECSGAG